MANATFAQCEVQHVDVVASWNVNGRFFTIGIEGESTFARNAVRNAVRGFFDGLDGLIVSCKDYNLRDKVEKVYQKHLPANLRKRILLTTQDQLSPQLIRAWVHRIAGLERVNQ